VVGNGFWEEGSTAGTREGGMQCNAMQVLPIRMTIIPTPDLNLSPHPEWVPNK
jgi:hypothetical protein